MPASSLPAHLRERFALLDALSPAADTPPPWRESARLAIGGLTEVGFGDSSDLLLVVSSGGRGVFDATDGSLLARDDEPEMPFDRGNLLVDGIGPLGGQRVRTGGLSGGGLALETSDGWTTARHPLAWPDEEIFLCPPNQTLLWTAPGERFALTKFANFSAEIRSFGFSPTGRTFVIATSADVLALAR